MSSELVPKTIGERTRECLARLNYVQQRFATALCTTGNIADAADFLGMNISEYEDWSPVVHETIDELYLIYTEHQFEVATAKLQAALIQAIDVKISGLQSPNERIAQKAATEIIEMNLGRSRQQDDTIGDKKTPTKAYLGGSPSEWTAAVAAAKKKAEEAELPALGAGDVIDIDEENPRD